ncbi:MAG: hypothetical protein KAV83_04845 [Desulfobacterales bacterium]|nr:hypothetical protein [Desulfobacterales bacterium]
MAADIEKCVIDIKQAIARIEEQAKTIFNRLDDYKEWSEKLHKEHFDATERLNHSRAEGWRQFDVRISKHDLTLNSLRDDLAKTQELLQQATQTAIKTKGIAIGLGMAGGAIVSILAILVELIK